MSVKTDTGKGFNFPVMSPISSNLAKKIEQSFDQMGYRNLRGVYCENSGNDITLRGKTTTFYLKQVAQVIATKLAGGGKVTNLIEVRNVG